MATLGNVVFLQTQNGLSKIELTQRLSDALDILGIQRYILLIDVYVEEFLGRRPTTTGSTLGKSSKTPQPHFPILQPLGLLSSNQGRKPSRSFQSAEAEVQNQVLQAYTEKIHELHGKKPWVLLVECSFQTRFDYVGLQQLGEKFDFEIHWLPIGTKGEMNAKFQSIVAKILEAKPGKSKSNMKSTYSELLVVETLHQNIDAFDFTCGNNSVCTFDSLDVTLASPPFFNTAVRKHGGRESSASYTSCEDASSSQDDSTGSEINFEDEVLEATMKFAKRLPSPDLHRYIDIANQNQYNNIVQQMPVFVVLVRDIFPGPASHISSLLKDTLQRKRIKCKRLVVSTLFVQPKSIDIMKHFALNQNCADFKSRLSNGCASLLTNILHFTLSKNYQDPIVIILDLEDERYVRLFPILDFCTIIGQKALVLEKRPDGTFEQNFNRVYAELKKGCVGGRRIRQLKLPKYNLTFIKEFLPLESSMELELEDHNRSAGLLSFISSDLSHPLRMDSHSTVSSKVSAVAVDPNRAAVPMESIPKGTGAIRRQLINFVFQKKKSSEFFTPPRDAISIGISKTKLALQGAFGISAIRAIFKRPSTSNVPESVYSNQEMAEVVESSKFEDLGDIDARDRLETVAVDENLNEVLNPKTSTTDALQIQGETGTEVFCRGWTNQFLSENLGQTAVVTDEEPSKAVEPKRSLKFPTPSQMCKGVEDYVPGRTRPGMTADDFGDHSRQSLIQICRLPQKKRRKISRRAADSSEESLFKAWVGIPLDVIRKKKPGLLSRILSSIRSGFRTFIIGPLRNAFRRTNRVMPSQLIRPDWGSPQSRIFTPPGRGCRTSTPTLSTATMTRHRSQDQYASKPLRQLERAVLISA